ncbi:hypothetical protein [Sphingomonas sp. PP-CC-3A-396]|uniref:hypothetical protein n=1 Tax=Sphingomonas sp. PP-CC-3A-396 TaxID=2135655 RepID=UPI001404EFC8|nr:hypothetical protein [Sphingomonas sp. PP-CC-3A-396]
MILGINRHLKWEKARTLPNRFRALAPPVGEADEQMTVSEDRIELSQFRPGFRLIHRMIQLRSYPVGLALKRRLRDRMGKVGVLMFDRIERKAEVGL